MVRLKINGALHEIEVDPDMPLLWALRDVIGLTGTKFGCGHALCGACTVHVDGMPTRACVTAASTLQDREIVTIEGVSGAEAEAVRTAWEALDVPQCGYCQSGQIMSAVGLLMQTPKPTDDDISNAMTGNICRCATYHRIRQAIHQAATTLPG
jgi:isoquinoline 1-oxidoreductase alpha subunit